MTGSCSREVDEIRARYAERSWPHLAYFVHGQAVADIDALIWEIDRLVSVIEAGKIFSDAAMSRIRTLEDRSGTP